MDWLYRHEHRPRSIKRQGDWEIDGCHRRFDKSIGNANPRHRAMCEEASASKEYASIECGLIGIDGVATRIEQKSLRIIVRDESGAEFDEIRCDARWCDANVC
jgi:hypothetical protein